MSKPDPAFSTSRKFLVGVWQDRTKSYDPVVVCPDEDSARYERKMLLAAGFAQVHIMKQTIEYLEL